MRSLHEDTDSFSLADIDRYKWPVCDLVKEILQLHLHFYICCNICRFPRAVQQFYARNRLGRRPGHWPTPSCAIAALLPLGQGILDAIFVLLMGRFLLNQLCGAEGSCFYVGFLGTISWDVAEALEPNWKTWGYPRFQKVAAMRDLVTDEGEQAGRVWSDAGCRGNMRQCRMIFVGYCKHDPNNDM